MCAQKRCSLHNVQNKAHRSIRIRPKMQKMLLFSDYLQMGRFPFYFIYRFQIGINIQPQSTSKSCITQQTCLPSPRPQTATP